MSDFWIFVNAHPWLVTFWLTLLSTAIANMGPFVVKHYSGDK